MNLVSQTIDMLKKKQPNLKWTRRVKNRSRPVIRQVGQAGGTPKRSTRRPRMNERKGENENEHEDDGEMGQSYPARRVKAS
jgi:hypothetical protein